MAEQGDIGIGRGWGSQMRYCGRVGLFWGELAGMEMVSKRQAGG